MFLHCLNRLVLTCIFLDPGNNTNENWVRTQSDLDGALAGADILLQAIIFPAFDTGNRTATEGLVNVTSDDIAGTIKLPYHRDDGSSVYLGDPGLGYPPSLYPNLTYHNATDTRPYYVTSGNETLVPNQILFMGPLVINEDQALFSCTTAVINNTSAQDILGWLTVVVDATMLYTVRDSMEGLGKTGEVLIVSPNTVDNKFPADIRTKTSDDLVKGQSMRFVLPPTSNTSVTTRHKERLYSANSSEPFPISAYPAVEMAWTDKNNMVNNAGAELDTRNEDNERVSVGYAQVATRLVDWILVVEQSYGEVVSPIHHLRDIVLICVFSVAAGLLLIMFPLAHYSVAPIRQLRAATKKTVEPYMPDDGQSGYSSSSLHVAESPDEEPEIDETEAKKEGFFGAVSRWRKPMNVIGAGTTSRGRRRRKTFRIPAKVPEHKHIITDELTDLIEKFNEMSDELTMQYERLEQRVKERTAALENSKQIAEAANQSKTLFIANISHELKTPLNGILGLTTVCMNEEDPSKIRSTLNTIYKSGDLLLHLLTDLLTFSKNEVGQQLAIDESEFRISDLSTQLMPTFERQAKEAQIDLKVLYYGTNDAFGSTESELEKPYGPAGTGRVKDMCLYGDKNRILQVLMNFVSNSLKFTPAQGSVTVRISCLGLVEQQIQRSRPESATRKSSMTSKKSKSSTKKKVRTADPSPAPSTDDRHEINSQPNTNSGEDSKLSINIGGETAHIAKIAERRRSMSPPPLNTKDLAFEFEVEDTGPGIPEDQQKKIFEPFVQGDLGLSKKYGGTGLGLSICAQLASLMGGDISLESKVGQGSKFTMRLPLRYLSERAASTASSGRRSLSKSNSLVGQTLHDESEAQQRNSSVVTKDDESRLADVPRIVGFSQPYVAKEVNQHRPNNDIKLMKQAETEAAEAGRKVRVLVAEDNKINQEVVLRMLKLEDVYGKCFTDIGVVDSFTNHLSDVTIAKDGQEAFDKVRESMQTGQRFHLVFMDVQMPNVDGIQSTKMIREMGFSAPIVALTAFAEKSNEVECMASGMDYFLAKPIRRPALKHVLKKYCATIPEEEFDLPIPSPGLPKRQNFEERRETKASVDGSNESYPESSSSQGTPKTPPVDEHKNPAFFAVANSAEVSPMS